MDDLVVEKKTPEEIEAQKRAARAKRRKRNTILAYVTVGIFLVLLLVALVFVGKMALEKIADAKVQKNTAEQEALLQEQLEALEALEQENLAALEETSEETAQEAEEEAVEEEIVVEKTVQEKLDEIVEAAIEVMTLEDKVAGLFLVMPESLTGVGTVTQAGDATREALLASAVGGIVYASKNFTSAEQMSELLSNTELYARYPLFFAVGESAYAQALSLDAEAGSSLLDVYLGLSVTSESDTDALLEELSTLQAAGLTVALSAFPDGDAASTASQTVASEDTLETLREAEFVTYAALIEAGVDMIIMGNMSLSDVTGDNTPATLCSSIVTDLLREELSYDGVILSGNLSDAAITQYYAADEAAILALRAGCDMLYATEDYALAYEGVLAAVESGTISEERINDALKRIYRIKYADKVQ